MNNIIKYISVIGIAFCLPLIYILFVRPELAKEFSREYLNHRLAPTAEIAAETTLNKWLPLLEKHQAPKEMLTFVEKQAVLCSEDPYEYVSYLTSGETTDDLKNFSITNPFLSKLIPNDIFFYKKIQTHFVESYHNLLNSLQIFFVSNLMGLSICLFLQIKLPNRSSLNIPSYIMFISLIYSTSTFLDQNLFFGIIFNTHMGIWYPILILLTFTKLMLKRQTKEFKDEVNDTLQETIQNLSP